VGLRVLLTHGGPVYLASPNCGEWPLLQRFVARSGLSAGKLLDIRSRERLA
jgi:hypothetical protein